MFIKRFIKEENGQSLVLVGLSLLILVGFAGLAIDGGRLYVSKSQLQTAVDAAALAAAKELTHGTEDDARSVAETYARKNHDSNDITITYTTEFPEIDKVKVTGVEDVPLYFIPVLTPSNKFAPVPTYAVAQITRSKMPKSDVWKFLIFSAATIDPGNRNQEAETKINGGDNKFNGDIHINGDSEIGNNPIFISGTYEYAGDLDDKHNSINDEKEKKSTIMELPIINKDEYIKKANKVFENEDAFFKSIETIKPTDIILVNGNVHFMKNSVTYKWTSLYVTGDIDFNGNGSNYSGLFYAPTGTIRVNGNSMSFKGSLFANFISFVNGSDNTFTYDGQYIDNLYEEYSIKLVE